MVKRLKKTIEGKTYKRYNTYKDKATALYVVRQLKDGKVINKFYVWYDSARVIKDDRLTVRKYVVWVHGKHGDRPTKGSRGKIKKGKKTLKGGSKYKPRAR